MFISEQTFLPYSVQRTFLLNANQAPPQSQAHLVIDIDSSVNCSSVESSAIALELP